MHAISSYRGNSPPPHTHRQDRLQYTAPQVARSAINLTNCICTQFQVIVVTDPQTHKQTNKQTNKQTHTQTDRTDYNTLRR